MRSVLGKLHRIRILELLLVVVETLLGVGFLFKNFVGVKNRKQRNKSYE